MPKLNFKIIKAMPKLGKGKGFTMLPRAKTINKK